MPKPWHEGSRRWLLPLTPWRRDHGNLDRKSLIKVDAAQAVRPKDRIAGTRSVMIFSSTTPLAWVEGPCPGASKSARLEHAAPRRCIPFNCLDDTPRPANSAPSQRAAAPPRVDDAGPHRSIEVDAGVEIGAPTGRDKAARRQAPISAPAKC